MYLDFTYPHSQKLHGVRDRDLEGEGMGPAHPIQASLLETAFRFYSDQRVIRSRYVRIHIDNENLKSFLAVFKFLSCLYL
jgi:hypothetical protein